MNVLSTLIPSSTTVKEIIKKQSLDLDEIENKYLFGKKCEKKLSRITKAKHKFKTIFTRLQKRLISTFPPSHQPFRSGSLSQNNQPGAPVVRGCGGSLFERAGKRR